MIIIIITAIDWYTNNDANDNDNTNYDDNNNSDLLRNSRHQGGKRELQEHRG